MPKKHIPGSTQMTLREFSGLEVSAMVLLTSKNLGDGENIRSLEDWLGDFCVAALAIDEERNT